MLLTHSQGGYFALKAAQESQDVKAVITLEPSGVPDKLPSTGRGIAPHLFIWGDYIVGHDGPRHARRQRAFDYAQKLIAMGVKVCWVDLPEEGIAGNSHMLMMDANRTLILDRIIDWIDRHQ